MAEYIEYIGRAQANQGQRVGLKHEELMESAA